MKLNGKRPAYNLGTLHTVPGYKRYKSFCAQTQKQFGSNDEVNCGCFSVNVDEILENDDNTHRVMVDDDDATNTPKTPKRDIINNQSIRGHGVLSSFQHNDFYDVKEDTDRLDEEYLHVQNDADLMMILHQKLGHISYQRIISMAKAGVLPKRLAKCEAPLCQACMFGKLTRKPTRYKGDGLRANPHNTREMITNDNSNRQQSRAERYR
jgi:GAG-pre-integrase domain